MNKKTVLITGGCGAIGYNLCHKLNESQELNVFVIDNLSAGANPLPAGVNFDCIDIGNTEKIGPYLKELQPDYIYHLAAHFANQNSVDHPISDVDTNIVGLINILEKQKSNANLKKFVYASSSCVYGNLAVMNEEADVNPYDTPYAINKYVGELYGKYYSKVCGIPIVSARIFNNFGPGEMPGKYRNVIPNFISKAINDEDIQITGTGMETRDFNFVDNTVDLLVRLALSPYHEAEVFNSGTGEGVSIRELAQTIIEITGSSSKITYTEPRGWDHIPHRKADISKSKDLLGYSPRENLRESLRKTADWIRQAQK